MIFFIGKTKVILSPLFFLLLAAMFLVDRTGIITLALLSSVIHECGHLVAMRLCKQPPLEIRITPCGMELTRGLSSSHRDTIIIALSGPFANMLLMMILLPFAEHCPHIFLIYGIAVNAFIVLLNCLPLRGLDGGELAYLFMAERWGERGKRLFSVLSYTVSLLVLFFGIFAVVLGQNLSLLLAGVYLLVLNLFKL